MVLRRITQLSLVCLALCSQLLAQVTSGTSVLFQLPGAGSGGTRILGFLAEAGDLNPDVETVNGAVDADQILVAPDGSRVYVVGSNSIQYFDASLQTLLTLAVPGPIHRAALTPNGQYLLVSGAAFYIVSTATNTIVNTNLGVSGDLVDFAISPDSKRAWLLQRFNFGGAITSIDLVNMTSGARVDISRAGETITYSPQGKLYVPSRNYIAEYDPDTLALLEATIISALPGRMHFNLDGSVAYFIDKEPTQGYGIVAYRTASHDVVGWPANVFDVNRPILDEIFLVSNDKILGLERSKNTLWEFTTSPLLGSLANYPAAFPSTVVFAAAVSNEIPSARFLYVLTENSGRPVLARVSLATGAIQVLSNAASGTGVLRYAAVPPQSGASQIIKVNDNQTVAAGGASKPLIAYVTDALGRPVFNQTVNFTVDPLSGVTLSTTTAVTNSHGYVQTTATLPALSGSYTVVITAGSASNSFALTVPSTGGGGGGGGGGTPSRFRILRGNGQMVAELNQTLDVPLTVIATTEAGEPLEGVVVDFSVVSGTGVVGQHSQVTDERGIVTATFFAQNVTGIYSFENNIVRATSALGSVDFTMTVIRLNPDRSGIPQVSAQTFFNADVGRGDVIPDFFHTEILSSTFPTGVPIPGVGLRVADPENEIDDGVNLGACINDTLSDNLGIARCDFQASCGLVRPTQMAMRIGELVTQKILLFPKPGSKRALAYVSGNGQSANIGQFLTDRFTAVITDGCGDPVPNATVTWAVTQGSAVLDQIIATSGNDGQVSVRVRLGSTAGNVQVTATLEGAPPVAFSATATVTVTSVNLVSGGGQTALAGTQFANPVVFVVRDNTGNPVPGVTVSFTTSGPAVIDPAQAVTNSLGQAQTVVTAGVTGGEVTVTAVYSNLTASATLTVRPPTLPLTSSAFSNAASGANGLVPCGLATVVGAGLVPTPGVLSGISAFGPLPYALGSIQSLTVNGIPAPIQAVSNQDGKQQVNFQTPCETPPGTATVVIRVGGVDTTVTGVPVFAAQPGIFTYAGPNNTIYGAVLDATTGQYVTPSNLLRTGQRYYLILTGLGLVTPPTATNSAGANQVVNLTAVVGVNNAGVPTQPARYLQGSIGVYYIEFTVDRHPTAAPGTVLLTNTPLAVLVTVGNQQVFSQPGVLLPGVIQGNPAN